eukprot:4265927-Pyramimonas_sp.AAC.1
MVAPIPPSFVMQCWCVLMLLCVEESAQSFSGPGAPPHSYPQLRGLGITRTREWRTRPACFTEDAQAGVLSARFDTALCTEWLQRYCLVRSGHHPRTCTPIHRRRA